MYDRKTWQARELKLDEAGNVTVAFAQLGVIDKDGDMSVPGSMPVGKQVPIGAYGHSSWGGYLPVGRGVVSEADGWAVLSGKFFTDTTPGRDTYLTVRALADLQEWSYGYLPLDVAYETRDGEPIRVLKRQDVFEVSPVLVGAGNGTHTQAIKGAKQAIPAHHTDTTDAAFDGPMMDANCPEDRSALRGSHAWVDPEGDPAVKASYKFIHHMVSADGAVGAANLRACTAGIGVLNGGRGGTTIPDADRDGVWRHLASHITDGGVEPPELRGFLPVGTTLADHFGRVLADVDGLAERVSILGALRAKEGRVLSADNLALIDQTIAMLQDLRSRAEPPPKRAQQIDVLIALSRLNGVLIPQ